MFAGIVRVILAAMLGLSLGLLAGCDSCGDDDDDSSGAASDDDDNDNDNSSPGEDDDNDDDNDDNDDDTTPFCADGYLTPAGDCLTQVDGGAPGHNGISATVAPDGSYHVAAARGRDLVVYSHPPGDVATTWSEEIVVHMAADPVIAFDGDGNLHTAFLDIFNDEIRWGVKAADGWSFEVVEAVGDLWEYTNGVYLAMAINQSDQPHLVYRDYANDTLRYAQRTADGWVYSSPFGSTSCGTYNGIAIDADGGVHLVTGGGGGGGSSVAFYATNASGGWQVEDLGLGSVMPALGRAADGVVHIAYGQLLYFMGPQRLRHRWGQAGDWKDELVLPDAFYMLYPYDVRVDGAGRAHLFYVATTLAETTSLEHTIKNADGEWTRDVLASDPDAEVGYYDVKAYPAGVDDYSAVVASAPRGLVFYAPRPGYEPSTLGETAYSLEADYYYGDGGDERFFYELGGDMLRYRRRGDAPEILDLVAPNSPFNARMVVDAGGAAHLYYGEHAGNGAYAHWWVHREDDLWKTEALPIGDWLLVHAQLVADDASMPHLFFYQSDALTHLWKQATDWAREDLEAQVDTAFAVAIDSSSTMHVAFFREDLGAIRHASKTPGGSWRCATALDSLSDAPAAYAVATDGENGDLAICWLSSDCHDLWLLERTGEAWVETKLFPTDYYETYHGCGVAVRQGTVVVVTTTGSKAVLQTARVAGQWTERVLDSSAAVQGWRRVFWDAGGNARFAYASEWAIQRAVVRVP